MAAIDAAIIRLEGRLAILLGLLETCGGAASGVLGNLTYLIQMSPIEMLLVARSCKSRTGGHHARLKYLLIELRDPLDSYTGPAKEGLSAFKLQTSCKSCVDRESILRHPL